MTNSLDIDFSNPAVRKLMQPDEPRVASGNKRQMVQLQGDNPGAPTHAGPYKGMSTHRLDASKIEVLVAYRGRYGEFDMTVDVYALPGAPIELQLICPKCQGGGRGAASRITSDRKKIEFDPNAFRPYTFVDGSRMPTNGGRLDVEPFECAWELNSKEKHVVGIRGHSLNLCKLVIAIDNNVAKDA